MSIPYYQIDAFTSRLFSGNPAGVCILTDWLPDAVLQSIAAENKLPSRSPDRTEMTLNPSMQRTDQRRR